MLLCRGAVLGVPRMSIVSKNSKAGQDQTEASKIAIIIVQELFYPATLGALLYNFTLLLDKPSDWKDNPWACLSVILILLYFTMDYVYTKLWTAKEHSYTVVAALCDAVALLLILLTERSINPIATNSIAADVGTTNLNVGPDIAHAAFYLGIVHVLYTVWCYSEKMFFHLPIKAGFAVLFFMNSILDPRLSIFIILQALLCVWYAAAIVQHQLYRQGWANSEAGGINSVRRSTKNATT